MLAVVGTVPDAAFPLVEAQAQVAGGNLLVDGRALPVNRGTAALIAAALAVGQVLGGPAVTAHLVGDIGTGQGSRRLYQRLSETLDRRQCRVLAFHYLQPDVDWHNRVLFAAQAMNPKPLLIADAGFMYAAKMSGMAPSYDLFTPDVGELAFLADEDAPHPFYTRGFILHEDNRVPELIQRAYAHDNAAQSLLVKGQQDYLAQGPGQISELAGPSRRELEGIGGTGDTLTGLVAALLATGMNLPRAARLAALTNRLAGQMAEPTPATQVAAIIAQIPAALERALAAENGPRP